MNKKHTKLAATWLAMILIFISGCTTAATETDHLRGAIASGNLPYAKRAISNGADKNNLDSLIFKTTKDYESNSSSTIHFALSSGSDDIAEYLIKAGADTNYIDNMGVPVLAYAASAGKSELFQMMLDKGADINKARDTKNTVLNYVLKNEEQLDELTFEKTADYIIKAGAKENKETEDIALKLGKEYGYYRCAARFISKQRLEQLEGKEGLFYIGVNGSLEELKALEKKGIDIFQSDKNGENLLITASKYGNKDIADYLLKKGFLAEGQNRHGRTALTEAVRFSQMDMADILMKHGAPLQIDKTGLADNREYADTLCYAAYNGNIEFIEKMKSMKYPFSKAQVYNAMLYAIDGKQYKTIKYLSEQYFPINTLIDDSGLMIYAAINSDAETLAYLTAMGGNVNQQTESGTTLYNAVSYEKFDNAEYLLKVGADPNIAWQKSGGESDLPLYYAAESLRIDLVKLLVKYGADVETVLNNEELDTDDEIREYLMRFSQR